MLALLYPAEDWWRVISSVTIFVVCAALYFVPGILAGIRHHKSQGAISVLNLFLGWTVVGWIVALIWASTGNVESNSPSA